MRAAFFNGGPICLAQTASSYAGAAAAAPAASAAPSCGATATATATAAAAASPGQLHEPGAVVLLVEQMECGETDVGHLLLAEDEALRGRVAVDL